MEEEALCRWCHHPCYGAHLLPALATDRAAGGVVFEYGHAGLAGLVLWNGDCEGYLVCGDYVYPSSGVVVVSESV